jgi:hypothetical protein
MRWLSQWYGDVHLAAHPDNRLGIDPDAQGTPVWICRELQRPWTVFWSAFEHLG